ncbi:MULTISPECIES: mycofactocin precursor MftA [Haloferacaceae]|uniref:Mycofactocin MftA n=1 Tax=Halorubrum glutamatedens TaxID=2707018 RepID=A0ABD5QW84_9EURY|nr:mycofactocin precursor MftA [Halobellus captivus]
MSRRVSETDPEESATDKTASRSDDDPDIEEDLFEEELRIDGICGVY